MYKYVKIGNDVVNIAIPENYQINKKVVIKIRDKYSINDEFQMMRRGKKTVKYKEYVKYVQSCLYWGNKQKKVAKKDRKAWSDYQWDEEKETREEFITKLEKAKLINGG